MSNPYDREFFARDLEPSYQSARVIAPLVIDLIAPRSVLDVGCGTGHFLRAFAEAGIDEVRGIDGDYVPRDQFATAVERFQPVDLAQPFALGRRFDLVVSLEVAEHLPESRAAGFVADLVAHGDAVLFSAAVPDQGGTGHVNERWPSYWVPLFAAHGYAVYDVLRAALWGDGRVAWWYRQNCLIFAPPTHPRLAGRAPSETSVLDRVHPDLYASRTNQARGAEEHVRHMREYLSSGTLFRVEKAPDGRLNVTRQDP